MRASDTEFRLRFWIIGGLIFLGSRLGTGAPIFSRVVGRAGYPTAVVLTLAVFFAAAWIRTWAAAHLDPEVIHSKEVHADALVAEGPYRHTRNPLYLGTILLATGFGLLFPPLGFVVVVVGMIFVTLRLILREEADLMQTQGASYQAYLNAVPRLLFAPVARVPRGSAPANWPKAFRGELFSWLFFLNLVLFFSLDGWLTEWTRIRILEGGVIVAIVVHLIVQPRRRVAQD